MLNQEESRIYGQAMKIAESDKTRADDFEFQAQALPTIWTVMTQAVNNDANPVDTTIRLLNAYRGFTEEQKDAINEMVHIATGGTFIDWMEEWVCRHKEEEAWPEMRRQEIQYLKDCLLYADPVI